MERLCRFAIQTASALEHLEMKNIIHPSVNSFNCLVVSEDEVSTVWEAAWLNGRRRTWNPVIPSWVRVRVNSSSALVYSQLVFLLPVGILNMLSLFDLFVLLWRVVIEVHIYIYIYIYTSHQKFERVRPGSAWFQDTDLLSMSRRFDLGFNVLSWYLNILRLRAF